MDCYHALSSRGVSRPSASYYWVWSRFPAISICAGGGLCEQSFRPICYIPFRVDFRGGLYPHLRVLICSQTLLFYCHSLRSYSSSFSIVFGVVVITFTITPFLPKGAPWFVCVSPFRAQYADSYRVGVCVIHRAQKYMVPPSRFRPFYPISHAVSFSLPSPPSSPCVRGVFR